jgi:plasmid replication initiation protein
MSDFAPIDVFDRSLTVKKSNTLIHSKYDLSVMEYRIILIGISYIQNEHNRNVSIPVSDYKQHLKIEHFNYKHLVEVLQKLRENSIVTVRINPVTNLLEEGFITGWVDAVHYKDGIINIRFNEDVWTHLIHLKEKYTQFQLEHILELNSKYSMRIYEILKSYEYIGYYIVNVDELRDILLLGNKYSRFNDLETIIVSKAVDEINKNTDLQVKYTPIKRGRRFDAIKFLISKRQSSEESYLPAEVVMARSMTNIELFFSIKSLIMAKYKVVVNISDVQWNKHDTYHKHALESTYLSLLADEWKDHKITNHKAFFAEHLRRLTEV